MPAIPTIRLNDGNAMPQLGYGVWRVSNEEAGSTVGEAVKAATAPSTPLPSTGTRRASERPSAPLPHPARGTLHHHQALERPAGLRRHAARLRREPCALRLDHVDLYLIHWPVPRQRGLRRHVARADQAEAGGRAKSIGVSNFHVPHLQRLIDETGVDAGRQPDRAASPLSAEGAARVPQGERHRHRMLEPARAGQILARRTALPPSDASTARRRRRSSCAGTSTTGFVVIPKSVTPSRIRENVDVFDFTLDADDRRAIEGLDSTSAASDPTRPSSPDVLTSASCGKVDPVFRSKRCAFQEWSIEWIPKVQIHFWVRCSRGYKRLFAGRL